MFIKLILISTMVGFVYMGSSEVREVQHLSLLGGPHPDSIMDAKSTITDERSILQPLTADTSMDASAMDHDSTHPGANYPKKRATSDKEGRQADLRPGCCG